MTDQAYEKSLLELMRNVPKDVRAEWEIQWFDDGTPNGHAMAPVGLYLHRGADEIERLLDKIADLSCQVSNGEAEIERLQGELDASHTNNLILAEENLSQEKEIERLEKEVSLQCELKHAACDREDRLLAALEDAQASCCCAAKDILDEALNKGEEK